MPPFITFDREDIEPGDLYINPENWCTINIKVVRTPEEGCVCEWEHYDYDDWGAWVCQKCGARVTAEVWD